MRILFVHPNYSAGAADIAGNWSPAWVAYIAGYLKAGGYEDYHFVDGLVDDLDDDQIARPSARRRRRHRRHHGHDADDLRRPAGAADRQGGEPDAVTVLGGIHPTFMFKQVSARRPGSTSSSAARARRSR
jgi:anaerobic magnesium-protoporphyrin IX monomethyl ester cyclase